MLRGSQPKAKLYDGVTRIHLLLLVPMVAVSLCAAEIDFDLKLDLALPALMVKDLAGQHEVVARFAEAQVNETSIRLVQQAIKKAVE
ncbi:MAG: hypothetical protein ACPGQC_00580 [Limisphaerales bacterium]